MLTIIIQYIPPRFTIHRVYGHQDDNTERKTLSTYTKLNIDVDHIVTTSKTVPVKINDSLIQFVVYVNNIYIRNKIDHYICQQSHVNETRGFLMTKYKWSTTTLNSIE